MSRYHNKNVEDSEQLEEILNRHQVEIQEDKAGKKQTYHKSGWLTWRSGDFGETESQYISNTLRVWGFLAFLSVLGLLILYLYSTTQ